MKLSHFLMSAVILAVTSCTTVEKRCINVIPYPAEVCMKSGSLNVKGIPFHFAAGTDSASINIIESFARQLSRACGEECPVSEGSFRSGFIFLTDSNIPKEEYHIRVSRKAVVIEASGLNGFNYAIQTVKQMLPVEIFGKEECDKADWNLPCCIIKDAPRFGYRGAHIDVARHFFGMEEMKRYIDIMEVHKLNTLHWHLTDDQGWRIEIKKYPKLTEVGSIRKGTCIRKKYDTLDGIPYGEGCWFTQNQIREIISYAAAKGIRIIPEIDLPGHMLAALTAYPELGCQGGPYEVWTRWGVSEDVLCAGKEETMKFLEDVLSEVADLFPGEYIHIGGDECPKVRWKECPCCQKKIKELGLQDDGKHTAEHYLQSYVTTRMEKFLAKKGKRIIGWDEIIDGEIAPDATVMSWRGTSGGIRAAKMGHDVIMTPNTYCYLDYYQTLDKKNEPFGIGGYLPIEYCYEFEPFVEDMTDEEKSHILGVQSNLWTEYIADPDHLHYMLLPRLAALSEVQWCRTENKSWERFLDSADELCTIYDKMGYNYSRHIFATTGKALTDKENGCVAVTLSTQGNAPIRYTLDGSEPTEESSLYESPVPIHGSCILKAQAFRNDGQPSTPFIKEFKAHKAMGRPVTITYAPHHRYRNTAPDNLTDGIRGRNNFRSKEWSGWYGNPLDATITMSGQEAYSSVTLGVFVRKGDYIFNPLSLSVAVSEDGKGFTEVAHTEYPAEGKDSPNGIKEYTVRFSETSAKYLKVTAETIGALPEWHVAKGSTGFLFVDEIIVD